MCHVQDILKALCKVSPYCFSSLLTKGRIRGRFPTQGQLLQPGSQNGEDVERRRPAVHTPGCGWSASKGCASAAVSLSLLELFLTGYEPDRPSWEF